jgi:predicted nuclease of predicted toxin-antitoxin system
VTIRFYLDEHISRNIQQGLERHGYEVVLAVDVGMIGKDDDIEHLAYAAEHGMVMVTFDRPFAGRTMSRTDHAGVICISEKLRSDPGSTIRVLIRFAREYSAAEARGRVFWLK